MPDTTSAEAQSAFTEFMVVPADRKERMPSPATIPPRIEMVDAQTILYGIAVV
jgi:hypothetical protein